MNTATAKEPLLTIGTIGSLIAASVVLMRSFGVPLTDDQASAINAFVAIAAPIVIALIGRSFVFSPNSAQNAADQAAKTGVAPQLK